MVFVMQETISKTSPYVTLRYDYPFHSPFPSQLAVPGQNKRTIVGGSEKMLVWDDLEPGETIKIYDKGITVKKGEDEAQ